MNKKVMWNRSTASAVPWVLAFGLIGLGTGEGLAACIDGGTASATAGSLCSASGTDYSAISATTDGALELTAPHVTATTGVIPLYRILAGSGGSIVFSGGLTADGGGSNARVLLSNGASSLILVNGDLFVERGSGTGAGVEAANSSLIHVIGDADIFSSGVNAQGIRVNTGASVVFEGNTTIRTTANYASGVISYPIGSISGTAGSSLALFNGLSVSTEGTDAHGLLAQGALNNRIVVVGPDMLIDTIGAGAHGLFANNGGKIFISPDASAASGSADGNSSVTLMRGNVTTSGTGANGVQSSTNAGSNTVYVGTEASIEASGLDASGLRVVTSDGAGSNLVEVFGQVQGGSGVGSGIFTTASAGQLSTVRIGNGARVQALSGQAITDDGGDSDFLVSGSAQVLGAINLGDGSDTLTFDGAAVDQITLFDGGDDVSAADGMVDTLTFSGVVATLAGANIVNWENISIDSGTITISDGMLVTGQEDGIGLTLASGGTLDAGTAMTLTGNVTLEDGGTFEASGGGAGVYTITGNVTNAGLISSVDGVSGDQVHVTGLYTGTGGVVALDTTLGDDSSATDVLYLDGASAGSSYLRISNAGGTGAQTVEGIKIIEVGGASDGTFSLVGDYVHEGEQAVVGGAYAYKLYQGGKSTPTDGNWYLRSELITAEPEPEPLYQAGVPVYESYPQILLGLNGLPTLQQRIGNRIWTNGGGGSTDNAGAGSEVLLEHNGVWARIEGVHNAIKPNLSTTNAEYDYNTFRLQAGVDGLLAENEAGALMGGIALHYTHGSARIRSVYDADSGEGRIGTDGFGLTGTLTWLGESGFYLDGQGQVTWYDSNLSIGGGSQSLVRGNDGFGYALSIEAGQRIAIDPAWSVTPQAQLVYSSIDFDDFTDAFGAPVGLERGDSLQGRLGIALEYGNSWQNAKGMQDRAHIYGIANLYHEFLDGTRVDVAGTNFSSENDRWWGGLGIGGSYNWDDDKYSIYGEGVVKTSLNDFGDSYSLKGTLGLRIRW